LPHLEASGRRVGADRSRKAAAELDASIAALRDELNRRSLP